MLCSTVEGTVQCIAVHCIAELCSAVQCRAVQSSDNRKSIDKALYCHSESLPTLLTHLYPGKNSHNRLKKI